MTLDHAAFAGPLSRRHFMHGALAATAAIGLPWLSARADAQTRPEPPPATLTPEAQMRLMMRPKQTQQIAAFSLRIGEGDLSAAQRKRLKLHLLDTLGCAIAAQAGEPIRAMRGVIEEFGGRPQATLIGGGGAKTAVDRAALYNGALIRYLDFMDCFAAPGEVSHPSEVIGGVLGVAELAQASGRELLLAVALAYQVQCRLIEAVPTIRAGLQNTVPTAFAVGAASARLLKLDATRAAHAIALAGIDSLALANIQAEPVAEWKGLSSADAGMRAVHNAWLARAGITGPLGVFEGPFGLQELVGHIAPIDWQQEGLGMVERCSIKAVNGEYQSQTAVSIALQLRRERGFDAKAIEGVRVDVPLEAYQVIGGGRYGPKDDPRIKEQADHNLKYMMAVALLDGDLQPAQYAPARIVAADVQALLKKVLVEPSPGLSIRTPKELPARVTITLKDGRTLQKESPDYEGFYARPMPMAAVIAKFKRLTQPFIDARRQDEIVDTVANLEQSNAVALMGLLAGGARA